MANPELLSHDQRQLLGNVRRAAEDLAVSLHAAEDAGISQAVLLPELVAIMREAGLMPDLPPFLARLLA